MIPPEDFSCPDNYGLHEAFKLTHCKTENVGEQQTATSTLLERVPLQSGLDG